MVFVLKIFIPWSKEISLLQCDFVCLKNPESMATDYIFLDEDNPASQALVYKQKKLYPVIINSKTVTPALRYNAQNVNHNFT